MKQIVVVLFFFLFVNVQAQSNLSVSTYNSGFVSDPVYKLVDKMPMFPGGQAALYSFMARNTEYPADAKSDGIYGTVHVTFVVTKSGQLTDVKVKKGLPDGGQGCNDEAVRVIKSMPRWTPGYHEGEAVNVQYTLPFKFKL